MIVTVVVDATRDHGFESPVLHEWLPPATPWTYIDSLGDSDGPMVDRKDKQSRREALDRWKSEQRAIARAKLPLTDEHLQSMFDMLDETLPQRECDHTLRLTTEWLVLNSLPIEPVVTWLHENGGYCDCEALANAEQAWHDATDGVN